jgi:hypothetical protein
LGARWGMDEKQWDNQEQNTCNYFNHAVSAKLWENIAVIDIYSILLSIYYFLHSYPRIKQDIHITFYAKNPCFIGGISDNR